MYFRKKKSVKKYHKVMQLSGTNKAFFFSRRDFVSKDMAGTFFAEFPVVPSY